MVSQPHSNARQHLSTLLVAQMDVVEFKNKGVGKWGVNLKLYGEETNSDLDTWHKILKDLKKLIFKRSAIEVDSQRRMNSLVCSGDVFSHYALLVYIFTLLVFCLSITVSNFVFLSAECVWCVCKHACIHMHFSCFFIFCFLFHLFYSGLFDAYWPIFLRRKRS